MADSTNAAYFKMRSDVERELSRRAADCRVANAHAELADRYAAMAAGPELQQTNASLVD